MDMIDRAELVQKLKVIEGVTYKSKSTLVWKSVFNAIENAENVSPEQDCTQCFVTSPLRTWKSIDDKLPTVRQKVLVKTAQGDIYIGFYMSKCWWIEHPELGDISHFFNDKTITEWREIE